MLVFSFIAGLFVGSFIGIILLSLLVAGKENSFNYPICPEHKVKHPVVDQEKKDFLDQIAFC